MVRILDLALLAAAAVSVSAQAIVAECGRGLGKCPSNKPCCSQYGQCGIGAYCLGGCDPLWSTSLGSCAPQPVCKSGTYKFGGMKGVVHKTKYLGDSSKFDWVADGNPLPSPDGKSMILTMAPDSVGTVVSSTFEVLYGRVAATMRTSRGAGAVTAFILFSDVKDEIDYEWVGADLNMAQTNFYFQGIPDYTNTGNISISTSTFDNWHTYELDWSPERLQFKVNGQVGRTVYRKDTLNETTGIYHYPQTPSRIQLSLWPGGLASNLKGTIEWAGGEINWNHPDVQKNGYYYAMVKEVEVECYKVPASVKQEGSKSYVFYDQAGLEGSVKITDKSTILKSFLATGTDPNKDLPKADKNNKDKNKELEAIETVPGMQGAGLSSADIQQADDTAWFEAAGEEEGFTARTTFDQGLNLPQRGAPTTTSGGNKLGEKGSLFAFAAAVLVGVML
ncbi:hypothetical protein BJ508DRAFT_122592 [Ascobolus immersus RN42]|uniref:GH16 domain-containing protein n=1 Tax=Ascobolus immersus RN42 TaxID=1160509 RepID=A0A3N4I3W5_ASCIM|nr:hypothetical protein BJ508DRAFT_122592 [Ascobolus immersus RN42]